MRYGDFPRVEGLKESSKKDLDKNFSRPDASLLSLATLEPRLVFLQEIHAQSSYIEDLKIVDRRVHTVCVDTL